VVIFALCLIYNAKTFQFVAGLFRAVGCIRAQDSLIANKNIPRETLSRFGWPVFAFALARSRDGPNVETSGTSPPVQSTKFTKQ